MELAIIDTAMYHQPSKRKQLIQRTVIYSLMSVAVVGLVAVLVFIILGYQFNGQDGKIEQGGLVQFESQPTGADVTIDGASFGTKTSSKTTMTAGQHFVTMAKSGYQQWRKSVTVVPGAVLWLNYSRLIPAELKPANVADFGSVSGTAVSPDMKWMAVQETADSPSIHLADISQDSVKTTTIELPAASYSHPAAGESQQFTLGAWSADSRHLLVQHLYGAATEWLVVDTQNAAQTKDVTKLLGVDISKVVFSGDNSGILYAQIGQDVRKIDLNSLQLSRPLVTNVAEFSVYDRNTIVFTTLLDATTKARSVGIYRDGADAPTTVRSYSDQGDLPLHLGVGKYFSDTYVAIAYGEGVEVIKGDLNGDWQKKTLHVDASMIVPGGVQYLSVTKNGRFVVAQQGATYMVYDMELNKTTSTTLKGTGVVGKQLQWLDEYMPWSDRDGMVRLYEFDGANQHDIMPVAQGFSVTLSPNDRYLYGITQATDGKFHLTRVRMILP